MAHTCCCGFGVGADEVDGEKSIESRMLGLITPTDAGRLVEGTYLTLYATLFLCYQKSRCGKANCRQIVITKPFHVDKFAWTPCQETLKDTTRCAALGADVSGHCQELRICR